MNLNISSLKLRYTKKSKVLKIPTSTKFSQSYPIFIVSKRLLISKNSNSNSLKFHKSLQIQIPKNSIFLPQKSITPESLKLSQVKKIQFKQTKLINIINQGGIVEKKNVPSPISLGSKARMHSRFAGRGSLSDTVQTPSVFAMQ
jgi:hypothetical protein